ncbi:unnamed protein product [Caenorhabditis angaria]|uniref:Sialin n=1 Tax=Caenorhabditis angaria TaxID=860376 RepID=A0A9P1NAL0_9PELO|nr:unnamed protein product [Caenorhabditis angaria]
MGSTPRTLPYGTSETLDCDDEASDFKHWKRRHVVAILALLGFANIYAMRANLSIAIVEMTSGTDLKVNGTTYHIDGDFKNWSPMTQGVVLSSFFYGYIISQLPGGYLAYQHGGKTLFFAGTFGTAIFTLLTPPLARMGYGMLVFARFMEGLLEGVTYPAMHVIWSHWAPPLEQTKLATFAFSGSYFGTVLAMPLSAYLGEQFGWPMIFWFFGTLGVIWCVVWFKNVYDRPADDPKITTSELALLQRDAFSQTHYIVPWGQILRSKPVWAIIIAHTAQNWGFYIMLTNLPKMLKDIAGYNLEKAGIASSLPYLLMGVSIIGSGQLADFLRKERQFETLLVRKLFCAAGFLGQSIFLLLIVATSHPTLIVIFFSISIGIGGICWSGFSVNHLDLAPQYAGHLMAASNTIATIPGILGPLFVGAIVQSAGINEWNLVLFVIIGFYIVGAAIFWKFADAKLQPWAGDHTSFIGQLE